MFHKFRTRQLVQLKHPSLFETRMGAANTYEVVRLMPADQTGEFSYRIKSGPVERAVRESEIQSL